jgi:hypothetical protein
MVMGDDDHSVVAHHNLRFYGFGVAVVRGRSAVAGLVV